MFVCLHLSADDGSSYEAKMLQNVDYGGLLRLQLPSGLIPPEATSQERNKETNKQKKNN